MTYAVAFVALVLGYMVGRRMTARAMYRRVMIAAREHHAKGRHSHAAALAVLTTGPHDEGKWAGLAEDLVKNRRAA